MTEPDARTEPATPRRRLELRAQGQIARSSDVTTAAIILAATAALHFFGADLAVGLAGMLRKSLSGPAWSSLEPSAVVVQLQELASGAARVVVPIAALVALAAVAVNLAQVGFLATTEPLGPEWGRLNPAAGMRRLLSGQGAVAGAAGLLKLSVLVSVAAGFIAGQAPALIRAGELGLAGISRHVGASLVRLGFQMAIGLVVLAVVDYAIEAWRFERRIRMTKEELRAELRQTEGDPQTRQRRRQSHRQLISQP